ncbi:hypothetical protein KIN20_036817 [Parelaphostrongylus tenuis]|uniref:THAP-type domain-containing protein n=1 Tax=Parelaphostrongylus tenuis TaxID=148309 RepID=A0AAD5RDP9_PARTN|nr:hypothetical protein KIN20_036817 [Parelaphostrongylus tenuis]
MFANICLLFFLLSLMAQTLFSWHSRMNEELGHYGECKRLGKLSFLSSHSGNKEDSTATVSLQEANDPSRVDSPRSFSSQGGSSLGDSCSVSEDLSISERPEEVLLDGDCGGVRDDGIKDICNLTEDGKFCQPLQMLWLRLRRLGCIIDVVQAKISRRKIKCSVENCVYKSGPVESVGLRCTLPSNIETAAQWLCICTADVRRQNRLLVRFFDTIKEGQPTSSQSSPVQTVSREKLLLFPFRICSRHFSTEWADSWVPIMPTCHLPEKSFIFREILVPQLRSRYIFLSESGHEDIEIDKLEPNGVLKSPLDEPIRCNVPGCGYESSDISIFSGRFMKFFSFPSNRVDYGKWCASIRDMLGLPTTSDFALPEGAHICEMHFLEGKRYTRNIMQDPTMFRKLSLEGFSSSLPSSLGVLCFTTCAVNSCPNGKVGTICVQFPKQPISFTLDNFLIEADESFEYNDGMAVCLRHFSLSHLDGCVPCLFLGGETTLETPDQVSLKRREETCAPQAVKKTKFEKSGNGSGASKSITAVEHGSTNGDDERKKCCAETGNILTIVNRIENQSSAVERLVEYLNSRCKDGLLPTFGDVREVSTFDILTELRAQKSIVHSLRQKLDEALRVVLDPPVH